MTSTFKLHSTTNPTLYNNVFIVLFLKLGRLESNFINIFYGNDFNFKIVITKAVN